MDLGIKDLRVLVTAGAGGIGLEIARAFVREGAKVHICDVDETALAAAKKSDPQLTQSVCDVADRGSGGAAVRRRARGAGRPRLPRQQRRHRRARPARSRRSTRRTGTAASPSTSPASSTACASPCRTSSSRKNASIMNLSSQAGKHGFPLRSAYAAAKWGVIGFTKSIAIELGPFGIRVNALLPGLVAGDRIRRVIEAKAQQAGVSFKEQEAAMFAQRLDQGLRDAAAARRHGGLHRLAPRQDHLRPGDLRVRRYEYAGLARGNSHAPHPPHPHQVSRPAQDRRVVGGGVRLQDRRRRDARVRRPLHPLHHRGRLRRHHLGRAHRREARSRRRLPHHGLEHVAFESADLEADIARLTALGAKLQESPIQVPNGPRVAFLHGPDDVRIELVQPPKK